MNEKRYYSRFLFTVIFIFFVLVSAEVHSQVRFKDVTTAMKVPGWTKPGVSAYGHGVAFADISGDSLPDIYISNAKRQANKQLPETFYVSHQGAPFTEEDGLRGISDSYGFTGSHGIVFFDYNNDGFFDIYNATTDDLNRLYRNKGNGFFEDVTAAAKLGISGYSLPTYPSPMGYGTRGVVAFDANNDGWMDLLGVNWGPVEDFKEKPWVTPEQPNEFYLNQGDGTYKLSQNRGLSQVNPSNWGTQGVTAVDVDNDGDIDVFVAHRNYAWLGGDNFGPDFSRPVYNQLFINNGEGYFVDEAAKRGLADDIYNDTNGATFVDYDNDGDLDLFVVPKDGKRVRNDPHFQYVRVYRNDGKGYFENITKKIRIRQWGFSALFLDVDNDGDMDLYAPCTAIGDTATNKFYLNNGDGTFIKLTNTGAEIRAFDPRGGATGDIDGDGDIDIYYADANKDLFNWASNRLLRNDTPQNGNRYIRLLGRGPKGDMGAFGTKIWVFDHHYMDDLNHLVGYKQVINAYGYLCQDDPVQHFGLGQRDTVDIKIQLLDKTILKMYNVPANNSPKHNFPPKRRILFSKPEKLEKIAGDGQSGYAGQKVPLQIRVRDAYNNIVYGAEVRFEVTQGNGFIQQSQPVYTNSSGIVQVDYVLGQSAGYQTIRATCPAAPNSSIEFTAFCYSSVILTAVSGSGQYGQIGQVLPDPLVVKVTDLNSKPLSGIPIAFKVVAGGGMIGTKDSVLVLSNEGGLAMIEWRMGPTYSTEQKLKAFLPFDPGRSVLFSAMTLGQAAEIRWLSPTSFSGIVGRWLPDTLKAKVIDTIGQPVKNHPVDILVTQGGGLVNGLGQIRLFSDANGMVRFRWRLGQTAGIINRLQVQAGPIIGSPVQLVASASADAPYRLHKISGDGQSAPPKTILPLPLVVAVTDTFNNPIAGHPVRFTVIEGGATINSAQNVTVVTDSEGKASIVVTTGSSARTVFIHAMAVNNEKPLADSPQVFSITITPPPPDARKSNIVAISPVIANGRAYSKISIYVRDQFSNPIANIPVFIYASGKNNIITQPSKPTDDAGLAVGYLRSTCAEKKTIWAEIGSSRVISDSVQVQFIAGPAAEIQKLSGDNQIGYVGKILPESTVVALVDSFNNPIVNAILSVIMEKPSGQKVALAKASTNRQGQATFRWIFSEQPGIHRFTVSFLDKISAAFLAEALPRVPARLEKIAGDNQTGIIGQPLPTPLVVRLTDVDGDIIPGVPVIFSVISGEATFPNGAKAVTDSAGRATILITLGKQEGTISISASVQGLDQSVVFSVNARLPQPASLQVISGDNQSARRGQMLPQPIVLKLVDELRLPISNVTISFTVEEGGGIILPSQSQQTNQFGCVSVQWQLGQEGSQKCKAYLNENPSIFSYFYATIRENCTPQIICTKDTTIDEMQFLYFRILATDADGDPVTIQVADLPAGAFYNPLTQVFSWQPSYDQAGIYRIVLQAVDNFGGKSISSCRIVVRNVIRPIKLLYFEPADSVILVELNKQVVFKVQAQDPEGDSLRYQWKLNDLSVGTQSTLKVITNPAFPPRSTVVVTISSRFSSIKKTWTMDILSSVTETKGEVNDFVLLQNYPNPFNPTTHITFTVPRATVVELLIFNQYGQAIRRLFDGISQPGMHTLMWDGRDDAGQPVPSGIYYCRMQSGSWKQTIKLLLLK